MAIDTITLQDAARVLMQTIWQSCKTYPGLVANKLMVVQTALCLAADDLMTMRDISVSESEDLPKILEPLVDEGPQAALGKAPKQPTPEAQHKQMLQIVRLTAPGIKKLQVLTMIVAQPLGSADTSSL